jgi:small-conductance mechanosensitive channel
MARLLEHIASLPLSLKLAFAVIGILVIHAASRLLEKTLPHHFVRADARYRVRKFVVFAGYVFAILFLVILFEERLPRVTLALGVAGAGLVVALQDVIASFAGWFAIGLSKLYEEGDRVQISDTRGDVVDVAILRTTIMETGNWVRGDLYNGRIISIPNSFVLKGPVFNYSRGFRFVWDEIRIPLTAQSDHQFARELFSRVVQETVGHFLTEAEGDWAQVTDNFRLINPRLDPNIALIVNGGSLEFTVTYIVNYAERTAMKDRLFTKIADEIAKSKGRLAWASSSTVAAQPSRPPVDL